MKSCAPAGGGLFASSPFGYVTARICWATSGVTEMTFTCQPVRIAPVCPSGIGFACAPGAMNVTPTRAARVIRTLHVVAVPRQALAHVPNFQPVPGCGVNVTLLPARARTVRLHE